MLNYELDLDIWTVLPPNLFKQKFLPRLWGAIRLHKIFAPLILRLRRVEICRLLFEVFAFATQPRDNVLLCGRVAPRDVPAKRCGLIAATRKSFFFRQLHPAHYFSPFLWVE